MSLDLLLFKSPSHGIAGPSHQVPGNVSQRTPPAPNGDSSESGVEQCLSFPSTPCTPRSLPDDSSPVCDTSVLSEDYGAFKEPGTGPHWEGCEQTATAPRGTLESPHKYADYTIYRCQHHLVDLTLCHDLTQCKQWCTLQALLMCLVSHIFENSPQGPDTVVSQCTISFCMGRLMPNSGCQTAGCFKCALLATCTLVRQP